MPPFDHTGMTTLSGELRTLTNKTYQIIGQGLDRAGKRKITYATLKLRGETYIVMPLPKRWQRGDQINI